MHALKKPLAIAGVDFAYADVAVHLGAHRRRRAGDVNPRPPDRRGRARTPPRRSHSFWLIVLAVLAPCSAVARPLTWRGAMRLGTPNSPCCEAEPITRSLHGGLAADLRLICDQSRPNEVKEASCPTSTFA
jgi:hypothetical protein